MKHKNHNGVACWLALALSTQTHAQTVDDTAQLTDLVVTAGITPIEQNQFGGSVTLITAADIAATQATYLSDVLRSVPGFAVSQSGGPGTQTQLRIRGSEANHVLVLIDGIRVNDPTANDEFLFNYAMVDNIERIEIVRGPQSAIWGTDAMSAVINIITRSDRSNRWGFDIETGSFNTKGMALDGTVADEGWRLSAGINALDSAGINIARRGDEADGFENLNANFAFDYDFNSAWSLKMSTNHTDALNEFDGTDFVITGLPVDADLWTERTQTNSQIVLKHRPSDKWHNEFSYQFSDVDAENFTFGAGQTSSTAAETAEVKLKSSVSFGTINQHRVSALLDHRMVDFVQRGTASPFGDPNQGQEYSVTGLAAEYHHQLNDQFSWNLSARQDNFNRFDDVSNYRLAASYQIKQDLRLRSSVGTGSKAPSFIERFGFFPANFIGNPNLKPEDSDAFEVAIEKNWANSQLVLVYFKQNLENEINGFVFDAPSGLFTAANQTGESERSGFELNLSSSISTQLDLDFNYTYTDATEENAAGMEVTEVRRPNNMASLSLDYRFADNRAQLYGQLNYQDDQLDVFFDPTSFTSSNVKLGSYTTFDLTFSWQLNQQLQLYAKGQNLFDENYEEVLGYARPGAAFYAGLKGSF
ncbi:TonB-dependent receptor [Marinicella sp. S1101]|uniref:TonB-dependent receptor plug domain-containing protein n=1 Tax=Marinicella marina TaxID=2996016 RepID=UPI002261002A|nr:TonB-dependent receptor [Marinicella marina]MCX7554253.1 TonB-dependent receptor [Marinicella marina]MDJ1138754.1 TonB-dependent receptor [Marinicella marina]